MQQEIWDRDQLALRAGNKSITKTCSNSKDDGGIQFNYSWLVQYSWRDPFPVISRNQSINSLLWKEPGSDQLQVLQMDRLAFGDRCSPYVAISVIHRVAEEYGAEHPEVAKGIKENLYMDDYLDSASTTEEAIEGPNRVGRRRLPLASLDVQLPGLLFVQLPGTPGERKSNHLGRRLEAFTRRPVDPPAFGHHLHAVRDPQQVRVGFQPSRTRLTGNSASEDQTQNLESGRSSLVRRDSRGREELVVSVADRFRDRDQQAGDRGKHLFPSLTLILNPSNWLSYPIRVFLNLNVLETTFFSLLRPDWNTRNPSPKPEHPHTTSSRPTRTLSFFNPYFIPIPPFVYYF